MMTRLGKAIRFGAMALAMLAGDMAGTAQAAELAKTVFGAEKLPSATPPQSYGFYSKGCFAGGVGLPVTGPTWQVMRLSRNRRWGEPAMINLLERLSRDAAAKDGWPGLLVGDVSQPRGGPMVTGHASHQVGLDADIWFTPMPKRVLTTQEREDMSAVSMLKGKSLVVDEKRWSDSRMRLLRRAASYPEVERIFVNPAIKKKLCDSVTGDRSWLSKIRPNWGHDYHFHVRIKCQPGSTACKAQAPPPAGDGCDKSLAWWFTPEPWKPNPNPKPPARDTITMASMPKACQAVANAPADTSDMATATMGGAAALKSKPIEAGDSDDVAPTAPAANAYQSAPKGGKLVPRPKKPL